MDNIFENNKKWAADIREKQPDFFHTLAQAQHPEFLWIGCSDSRVVANQIMGLQPGDVFVHRNIANLVVHADFNALSVIHYAVEYLKVKHIIVCGHYGCGGVEGALSGKRFGLIDSWLQHIKDVEKLHEAELSSLDERARLNRMCELNVLEQANNVCETPPVQTAWEKGQFLQVHSLIYGLEDGLLKKLSEPMMGTGVCS